MSREFFIDGEQTDPDAVFATVGSGYVMRSIRGDFLLSRHHEGPITITIGGVDGEESFRQESWAVPQPDGSVKLLPLDRG